MKFLVIVIFKNGMKLDKAYDTRQQAVDRKHRIYTAMQQGKVIKFADSAFFATDILCVTVQEMEEKIHEEV